MKTVTFARDMAPHVAGESRVVPDDVAARLHKSGDVGEPRPFPDPAEARDRKNAARRPAPAATYSTKGK